MLAINQSRESEDQEHVPVKATLSLSAKSLLLSQTLSDKRTGQPSMRIDIPVKT